jgi:hypothetical protein
VGQADGGSQLDTIIEGLVALDAKLGAQSAALGASLEDIKQKQTGTDAKLADLKTRDSTEYWKKQMLGAQQHKSLFETRFPAPENLDLTGWPKFLDDYKLRVAGKPGKPKPELELLLAALEQLEHGALASEDSAQALMTAVHTFLCELVDSKLAVRDTHTKYAPTHPWHKFDHVFVPTSSVSSDLHRTVSWDHVVFTEQLKKDVGRSRSDAVVQLADDMTEIFRKQPNRTFLVSRRRHHHCQHFALSSPN